MVHRIVQGFGEEDAQSLEDWRRHALEAKQTKDVRNQIAYRVVAGIHLELKDEPFRAPGFQGRRRLQFHTQGHRRRDLPEGPSQIVMLLGVLQAPREPFPDPCLVLRHREARAPPQEGPLQGGGSEEVPKAITAGKNAIRKYP